MNPYLLSFGTLVLGSLLTFLFGRRKTKAEIRKLEADSEKTEIDGLQAVVNMWKEANQHLTNEVRELRTTVEHLTKEVHELRKENLLLKGETKEPNSERSIL